MNLLRDSADVRVVTIKCRIVFTVYIVLIHSFVDETKTYRCWSVLVGSLSPMDS
jgi:hypothetical protein